MIDQLHKIFLQQRLYFLDRANRKEILLILITLFLRQLPVKYVTCKHFLNTEVKMGDLTQL